MRNSTKRSILGVAVMAVVFAAGASAHNGRSATKPAASAPASKPTAAAPIGMVQDWTNEHVLFRNVETPEEAKAKGRYERWKRLYRDPRFSLALTEKLEAQAYAVSRKTANGRPKPNPIPGPVPDPGSTAEGSLHRDWSHVMGGASGVGNAGTYPAKYSFNIMATPSCANDFVVYATGAAGAADSGGTHEVSTGTFTATNDTTGTITVGAGGRALTFTASTSLNSDLNFLVAAGTTNAVRDQKRDNLAAAINRYSNTLGVTATTGGTGVVLITANTAGSANIPASLTSGGAGFTIFAQSTDGTGTAGQPSIIAYNQLYNSTCNATRTNPNPTTHPDVYWAYNTGGTVRTSPVMSYYDNAAQIVFVQSNGSNQAELVLLKWKTGGGNGTAGAPATPTTAISAADYRNPDSVIGGCTGTAACMYRIVFNGTPDVTYSSPFIDYSGNIAYVGDDAGSLHKFTGIFAGNPAEVVGGGFPAVVNSGAALSPPVYDFGGNVFVGSSSGAGDSNETWSGVFTGAGPSTNGQTLVVNGQTLTASTTVNTGSNFQVNVGATNGQRRANDANNLAAAVNRFSGTTGISASSDGVATVTFTNIAAGNVAGTLVAEGVDISNFTVTNTANGSTATGGMLHKINATNGAVTTSAKIAANNATGFRATPMIDLKASVVYASTSSDGTNRAIYRFPLNFTAGATGSKVSIGLGTSTLTTDAQYVGRFDSAYRSSTNGTGNLYVCGSLPGDATSVALWRIPITAGVMGAPVQGATLSTSQSLCSPVSMISNGANQYMYAAVPAGGSAPGCTGACLYMYNLNALDAGTQEQWSFTFPTSQTVGGGTFIMDTVTFTALNDNNTGTNITNCTATGGGFDIFSNGGEDTDGQILRGCASLVPGFTTSGTGPDVIITRNAVGNVADNLVREGIDMNNFQLVSHTDGAAPSTTWGTTNVAAAGLNVAGGISGIVLDNISTLPGTSQIYFSGLASPGNAIQTSQSGLQ